VTSTSSGSPRAEWERRLRLGASLTTVPSARALPILEPDHVTARFLCVGVFDCLGVSRAAGSFFGAVRAIVYAVRFCRTSGCGGEEVVDAKERGDRGEGA
jgi:hypothetical protein